MAVTVAAFAYQFGLNNDAVWGRSRQVLFLFGISLWVLAVFIRFYIPIRHTSIQLYNWFLSLHAVRIVEQTCYSVVGFGRESQSI